MMQERVTESGMTNNVSERYSGNTNNARERRYRWRQIFENAATHLVLKYIPFFTYPKSNRGFSSPPQYSTIKH